MSITFKLGSLAIRTLAKPLSNTIKRNAAQHENFRRICVSFAQTVHRIDMRLRLGLLQDPAVIERQIQRELKEAEKKRQRDQAPTVKTKEQTEAEDTAKQKERHDVEEHVKAAHKPPKIRPLSENKAIETGANFIAESFLFMVACALILAESWRRDRKDKKADEEVNNQLETAEKERAEMKERLELLQAEIELLMDNKPFQEARAAAAASIRALPTSNAAIRESTKAASTPVATGPEGSAALPSARSYVEAPKPKAAEPKPQEAPTKGPVKPDEQSQRAETQEIQAPSWASSWLPSGLLSGNSKGSDHK